MFAREISPESPGQPSSSEVYSFDYSALDSEVRIVVQQRTSEIKEKLGNAAQVVWEIGQKLADVRARLKSRQLTSWLQTEFHLSRRTAYNYINVFESFDNRANFAQIKVATSALYLLAAPSTSREARAEALERAEQGESITYTEAKAIRTRHQGIGDSKNTKSVIIDTPALTLECESSALRLEPSKDEGEMVIDPIRYAIAPPIVEAGENNPDRKNQNEQRLLVKELEEPLIEISAQAIEAERQESEVALQLIKVHQLQVIEPTQDDIDIKDQSEEDLQQEEVFKVVGHFEGHLVNTHAHPSSSPIAESKNDNERPKTALYRLYCITASKTLEYLSGSPNLKFLDFDEVAKDFSSSTEFAIIVDLLEQEEINEVFGAITHRVSMTQIVHTLPTERLYELSQVVASRTSQVT